MKTSERSLTAKYIETHVHVSGRPLEDIAQLCGFRSGKLIGALMSDDMKVPLDKVKPLAQAIGADWLELFGLVIKDWYSPGMVDLFETYFGNNSQN